MQAVEPQISQQDGSEQSPGAASNGTQHATNQSYLRSTIGFPYTPIKDAELVAGELHDKWGGRASPEQLAAGLGSSPKSGAFRIKVSTARTFCVIVASRGSISLTDLGRRLIDPQAQAAARVEAFMAVPLFAALADEYKGSMLPSDAGLERKIGELGVTAKQTAKARQAFQRSAELAGFFKHGRQRLVPPANLSDSQQPPADSQIPQENRHPTSTVELPAPLPELWLTLLRDGRAWPPEKTQEFVQAARTLQDVLSKEG
jgi:hypothetical protein